MTTTIRILHLEDEDNDAALVKAHLDGSGLDYLLVRIKSMDELSAALMEETFDLIISDYAGPQFGGEASLAMSREKSPQTPFIFVSGTMGEDVAVQSLLNGATDYILKTGSMKRLGPAVQRALREVRERAERAAIEHQMRQAQKIDSIGRLAGGVAHDFNNILTAINGYAHFLIIGFEPGDPKRADAEEIKKAGDRAAALTRQLLAFSRQQVLQPKVFDLNVLIVEIEKMLRRIVSENIPIALSLAKDLGHIKADPGQIEQVILNLVVNARDAMPQGGKITIETGNVELSEVYARTHPGSLPGPHVMLAISDTGTGMTPDTMARLFEPFFTTKELGKGTGLGLSTVYGIIKQSGGYISVCSEPGIGSVFKTYLPAISSALSPVQRGNLEERDSLRGSETILLVEDDAAVRKVTLRLLSENGYAVLEAQDAEKAIEIAKEHKGPIHLLLTDLVMPGMRGDDLANQLAPLRPEMKIIFTSGYTEAGIVRQGLLSAETPFIQKPVDPAMLNRIIRETLDKRKAEPQ